MTDAEAKVTLLKIVYDFEIAGLLFMSVLDAQITKARVDRSTRALCPP